MSSNSKCGLSEGQRVRFLKDHGFVPLHHGKGSHESWEHPELKFLARSHKITPPANLLSNPAQRPWETTLCDNPASGTWNAMVKHAEWCQKTVADIKAGSEIDRRRCDVARQFREAAAADRQWRHEVKFALRTGADVPPAPMKYEDLLSLKAGKSHSPTPSR